ncbi:aromatic acid/H+ symport family MFS transporter [Pantoea alhagi]|uniref:MFS transporter n=1 Tax=Pantoea alhagi TaxID=1891675 RepID=UPI00202AEDAA|nr:aromatic acid/H+ symport family MFS transporter [Pantoea alhagi]URQ62578.1 aromatic acid/H+ symport family MFS transporter [Pantoea alhagi]
MDSTQAIDVRQQINQHALSTFQRRIIALCFIIVALDGMDIALMGFIAPALRSAWQISSHQLGMAIGAALVGLALGAMFAGPLADRYGRRWIIICSVFFFGLWTLATALAQNIEQMMLFRLLTGLGLGAAMPNVGTLVSEYAPERQRAFLITVVFCGFTFGAASGGFAASWLIPPFGWHAVLLLGGILPLLLLPLLLRYLPESVRFLLAHQAPHWRIRAIVEKMWPGSTTPYSTFLYPTRVPGAGSIRTVLSGQYRFGSLMLWGGYFMGLFLVYLIGSWMPALIGDLGLSVTAAALITAMYQAGGTVGSLFAGWLMDRVNANLALAAIYFGGALATILLGCVPAQPLLMAGIAFCCGFCFNGANTGMNALAASYYPTAARATGSSWMHGIGRIGAILSAFAGAQMLALGWSFSQIFMLLALPAVFTTLMLLAKQRWG